MDHKRSTMEGSEVPWLGIVRKETTHMTSAKATTKTTVKPHGSALEGLVKHFKGADMHGPADVWDQA